MKKCSRFLLAALLCSVLVPFSATTSFAAPEIIIKAAHNSPAQENQAVPWARFKEYVEAESNGRIAVEIYGGASMGACLESGEKVQMGVLQMHAGSTSNLSAMVPEWGVFELPYILQETLDNEKLFYENGKLGGPVFEKLDKLMLAKGLKIIFITPVTFRALGVIKADAKYPADVEGMKVRVTASRIERDTTLAFNMSPTTMAFGEVYTSLQQGTIDGLGLGVDSMYLNKFNEVLKSIIKNEFNAFFMVASVNPAFYNGLPDWARTIVDDGIAEAMIAGNEQWDVLEARGEAKFIEEGVLVHTPNEEELKAWKALAQPVYDKYAADMDPEWLKLVTDRLK